MVDNPNPKDVGLRLRAGLRKLGLSIEAGSRALGVPRNVLSNWVNGYVLPKHASVRELTLLLPGLTMEWIFWGDDRLVPGPLARELAIFTEAFRQKLELPEEAPDSAATVPGGGQNPHKQAEHAA